MSETVTTATVKAKREVSIKYRDVRISYEVDETSIGDLAERYEIEWADMKRVLVDYGIAIRRGGEVKPESNKNYVINLVDTDKVVKPATKTTVVVATAE